MSTLNHLLVMTWMALLVPACAQETTRAEESRTDDRGSASSSESEGPPSSQEASASEDTGVITASDTGSATDSESTLASDTPSSSNTHSTDTEDPECTPPSLPIVSASLPCGAAGTVVVTGLVDGVCLSQTFEKLTHSFNQFTQPYTYEVTFGNGGALLLTWDQDIYHASEGAVTGELTLPLDSALSQASYEAGSGSVLRTPQMMDDDYRVVLRGLTDADSGATVLGEVGLCILH